MGGITATNERTFNNLVGFYAALLEAADPPNKHGASFFTGHITKIAKDQGIAGTKYTTCIYFLREMGCITQLRRGAKSAMSVWQLNFPPTQERYEEIDPGSRTSHDELVVQVEALEQRVLNLESQLGGINIQSELANLGKIVNRLLRQESERNAKSN